MTERYYSLQPDEQTSKLYMNYNVAQAQAPTAALQAHNAAATTLMGSAAAAAGLMAPSSANTMGTVINAEYDYLTNTAYYTTVTAASMTAAGAGMSGLDINNNTNNRCSTLFYNGVGGAAASMNRNAANHNHIYTNKVMASSLMTKYCNASSYMHGATAGTAGNGMICGGNGGIMSSTQYHPSHHDHVVVSQHQTNFNTHNSHHNAMNSSYNAAGYQRNRYMPYNRTASTTQSQQHHGAAGHPHQHHYYAHATGQQQQQQHHNHHHHQHYTHAQSNINTNAALTTAALTYGSYQQFAAPIYQTCPPGMLPPLNCTQPLTAVAIQPSTLHTQSIQPSPGSSASGSTAGSEYTYANAVASSLASATQPGAGAVATTTAAGGINTTAKMPASCLTNTVVTSAGTSAASSGTGGAGVSASAITSTPYSGGGAFSTATDPNDNVTLQITNLDYSMDEASLRNFLLNQLKPITPVVSLTFEGSSYAKVTVPDLYFAKQVVSNLHRKKIGHKRMLVSYTRDSSLTEINTLRCQVAGLLKDVPCYTLPMYKFRELFQSRFKTSISVLDLYKMPDICIINSDNNEEKFITLHPDLVNSLESSPLMEGLQHSVPYCTIHFKRGQHKGWAEQEIEPLPNVYMTINEIQKIIHPLLKNHPGDIPVASLVHCIEGQLKIQITANDNGVNMEHLVCCVQGIQITVNNFGIKILGWLEYNKDGTGSANGSTNNISSNGGGNERNGSSYSKNSLTDPLYQISREVIELVKMSPKATMKFNRFIPAYHNHFGKQCRVADYGYTKLIELFEALSSVVQIMGDGENRQITLTHRTQIRRFTSDLLRVLRAHGNKSVLLSQLPNIFTLTQNRSFDVTDYGVCDIVDILDGLVNSNIVVVTSVQNGQDILISIPKRKQTISELEKTCIFAGEIVELFRNAPQYTILFQKFVRSYHYHFGYQCRLSDYGFLKLADLMEAIHGVVEMELTNDEDKKIYLSPRVARRVFAEQCEELIQGMTGSRKTCMKLEDVLKLHKKKFGYQITPQTLGVEDILKALEMLPYIEILHKDDTTSIICHNEDEHFRSLCYKATKHLLQHEVEKSQNKENSTDSETTNISSSSTSSSSSTATKQEDFKKLILLKNFIREFNEKHKESITVSTVKAMKHAIEIVSNKDTINYVRISQFMKFLMSIIRLLEQRPTMLLHEIKNALDCSISSTFEFGYPNLYTLLTAYPDIFCLTLGVSQERSEVTLLANTEMRLSNFSNHKHLFGSIKLSFNKQKSTIRSTRPALSEHNCRVTNAQPACGSGSGGSANGGTANGGPPPAKTRALSSDAAAYTPSGIYNSSSNSSRGTATTANNSSNNTNTRNNNSISSGSSNSFYQALSRASSKNYANTSSNSFNNLSGSSSTYSTASSGHHSNFLNTSSSAGNNSSNNMSHNKENSFNSSLMFSNSFNSSGNTSGSYCDLNSSMNSLGTMPPQQSMQMHQHQQQASMSQLYQPAATKLWDRRHTAGNFYQQQNASAGLAPLLLPSTHQLIGGHHQPPLTLAGNGTSMHLQQHQSGILPVTTSETSSGLYELVNNIQMCPMYEPPKPDTPPSENMPFWIDPIWANNGNSSEKPKDDLLNIRLPELKALNVLPMLLSPYSLSKTENMKQVFNFDSHDRKIA